MISLKNVPITSGKNFCYGSRLRVAISRNRLHQENKCIGALIPYRNKLECGPVSVTSTLVEAVASQGDFS